MKDYVNPHVHDWMFLQGNPVLFGEERKGLQRFLERWDEQETFFYTRDSKKDIDTFRRLVQMKEVFIRSFGEIDYGEDSEYMKIYVPFHFTKTGENLDNFCLFAYDELLDKYPHKKMVDALMFMRDCIQEDYAFYTRIIKGDEDLLGSDYIFLNDRERSFMYASDRDECSGGTPYTRCRYFDSPICDNCRFPNNHLFEEK